MTDEELSQYRKLLREAEDLQYRVNKLYDKEMDTAHSTVRGSSKKFPYTEFRYEVWVDNPKQVADRDRLVAIYQERLDSARKEILKIEQYIRDIPDSELRQIFEYRYTDGMKLREIGDLMNMDWSGIGKKIRNYLNFPTHPQKT